MHIPLAAERYLTCYRQYFCGQIPWESSRVSTFRRLSYPSAISSRRSLRPWAVLGGPSSAPIPRSPGLNIHVQTTHRTTHQSHSHSHTHRHSHSHSHTPRPAVVIQHGSNAVVKPASSSYYGFPGRSQLMTTRPYRTSSGARSDTAPPAPRLVEPCRPSLHVLEVHWHEESAVCRSHFHPARDVTQCLTSYCPQIGINYRGQPNQLYGCVNDARNVQNFLIRALYLRPYERRLADTLYAQATGTGRATQYCSQTMRKTRSSFRHARTSSP